MFEFEMLWRGSRLVSPYAAPRPCNQQLCPHYAEVRGRCAQHAQRARIQRAADSGDAFYASSTWRRLRKMKLARSPLCEVADCYRTATVVDHRLDRRTHPELTYVIENLTSMCKSHHDSKTARTRSGWGRRGAV